MQPVRIALRLLAVAALAAAWMSSACAAWPEKPVRMVVPFLAGSMGEVVARIIGDELRPRIGQQVLVETRPGGGGNPGAAFVAQSPADGYTLLVAATNNLVINQFLYRDLGFDPLQAFEPVTMLADVPSVLFIGGAVPVTTFAEFVTWAKANPGKVNYGSPGSGSTPHLYAELINQRFGLGMTHVPYKGAGQVVQAVLGGDIQFYLAGAGVGVAHVKAGKFKALAAATPRRMGAFPEVPTFTEAGLRDVPASNWWGLAAPRGTSPEAVERLYRAIVEVLALPAVRERFTQLGLVGIGNSPAGMRRQLDDEAAFWKRSLPALGVKAD